MIRKIILSIIIITLIFMLSVSAFAVTINSDKMGVSSVSIMDVYEDTQLNSNIDADVFYEEGAIYFDTNSAIWTKSNQIYCHIWKIDGSGEWLNWRSNKEKCISNGNGVWTYYLSKTGNIFEGVLDNYAIIFYNEENYQTAPILFSTENIGDTACCTGEMVEPYPDGTYYPEYKWQKTIKTGITGDTNNDGFVDILDVTYLQRSLIEVKSNIYLCNEQTDVNKDYVTDIIDATIIQKYKAKICNIDGSTPYVE